MSSATEARSQALLAWYRRHRRDLPWRRTRDPWAILVSEVMLQQTQAKRVVPFFGEFMARYPDPGALAIAPPSEVLAAWSGLGYNRRALRLREAARHVVEHGWPTDTGDLEQLPGVGRYTAAAVACFAFGRQLPTVETNLRRVLSRWHGRPLQGRELEAVAGAALPAGRATDWNQAVMDLSALLCTPARPQCGECPVEEWCTGPDAYQPPPRQGRFEGSSREARGAVLRALIELGPATVAGVSREVNVDHDRARRALESLAADGLVKREGNTFLLPEA